MLMQLTIFSSSAGEVFACTLRIYTDVVQQQQQHHHHSCCLLIRRSHIDDVNFVLVFQPCVCLPGWLVGVDKTVWRESICFQGNSCLEFLFVCFLVWKSLHPIGFYISSGLKGLIGFGFVVQIAFSQYQCSGRVAYYYTYGKINESCLELEAKSQWLARVCQIAAAYCSTLNRQKMGFFHQTTIIVQQQKYLIVCSKKISCSRRCGTALDARSSFTGMMSIFSTANLEYPGEREYIILAILSWVFRWTQQTVCRLMIKGSCFPCVSKEKSFLDAYLLGW